MSTWQQDAIVPLREAKARATKTSNITLHQACGQAIEVLVAQVVWVPSDLCSYARMLVCSYARQLRRLDGITAHPVVASVSGTNTG